MRAVIVRELQKEQQVVTETKQSNQCLLRESFFITGLQTMVPGNRRSPQSVAGATAFKKNMSMSRKIET